MKKFISVLLSAILIMSLSLCAYADKNTNEAYTDFDAQIQTICAVKNLSPNNVDGLVFNWTSNQPEVEGVLSALVRDWNSDGEDELLVLTSRIISEKDTYLGAFAGDYSGDALAVCAEFYKINDGDYELMDHEYLGIGTIQTESVGPLCVGTVRHEGKIYLFTYSSNVDETTYGSVPFQVYHLEGDKLIYDYIGGHIGWGQSNETGDLNKMSGAEGMEILGTAIADRQNDCGLLNVNSIENNWKGLRALSPYLLTAIFTYNENGSVHYEYRDYTNLENNLLLGKAPVYSEPEEDTEVVEKPADLQSTANAYAEKIAELSGETLTLSNERTLENPNLGNIYLYSYSSSGSASLQLSYIENGAILNGIGVFESNGTQSSEWLNIKDAVIDSAPEGTDASVLASYKGEVSFGGSPVNCGENASVLCGNAGTSVFRIDYTIQAGDSNE